MFAREMGKSLTEALGEFSARANNIRQSISA